MKKIVFASTNDGKINEARSIFSSAGYQLLPQSDYQVTEVEENAGTFIENAFIKARHACQFSEHPVIADDSGIVVDVLNGAPGIHSARYAHEKASAKENNQKLLMAVHGQANRQAYFYCVVVLFQCLADPVPLVATGVWPGLITQEPVGENGHGYDPIFFLPEYGCTAAEMQTELKNRVSHRAKALQQLLKMVQERG